MFVSFLFLESWSFLWLEGLFSMFINSLLLSLTLLFSMVKQNLCSEHFTSWHFLQPPAVCLCTLWWDPRNSSLTFPTILQLYDSNENFLKVKISSENVGVKEHVNRKNMLVKFDHLPKHSSIFGVKFESKSYWKPPPNKKTSHDIWGFIPSSSSSFKYRFRTFASVHSCSTTGHIRLKQWENHNCIQRYSGFPKFHASF